MIWVDRYVHKNKNKAKQNMIGYMIETMSMRPDYDL